MFSAVFFRFTPTKLDCTILRKTLYVPAPPLRCTQPRWMLSVLHCGVECECALCLYLCILYLRIPIQIPPSLYIACASERR